MEPITRIEKLYDAIARGGTIDFEPVTREEMFLYAILRNGGGGGGDGGDGGGISVTGATVGQTVKIASVDENGKPTAWEPVDFPSGEGGKEWRLINTFTIETEDLKKVYFNTDLDGKPFELKELWIVGDGTKATTHTDSTKASVFIRLGNGTVGESAGQHNYHMAVNTGTTTYQRGFLTWFELISETMGRAIAASLANQITAQMGYSVSFAAVNKMGTANVDFVREIGIFPGEGSSVLQGVGTVISIYGR